MDKVKAFLASPAGNALLAALFAFLVYLKTLAPSVTFIDSGELGTVASTLGIAHPTGYPLFTLVGWVFSKLPTAAEEITRLNIMAAFFCAAGVFNFYFVVHFILGGVFGRSAAVKFRKKEQFPLAVQAVSTGTVLLLAFSETYWSQATAIEVYSLHLFFVSLVSLSFFKAVYADEWQEGTRRISSNAWWYIFAFTLGLAFTNHMTTILLAPGFLFLYFATQGFNAESWKRILRMVLPFLLGFSAYVYLPIRASQSPAMNWGNPVTLERFLWHWTGKQYRVWIFSSTEAAGRQFNYFVQSLPYEFAYVGVLLAIPGVYFWWKAHRTLAVTFLLLFFGCLLYSINYDIHDIDSYFLLAYIALAFFAAGGLLFLFRELQDRMKTGAAIAVVLALCLAPLAVHYEKSDESGDHLVEDYTMNMFNSLQPDALVLSFQWDYWVSASFYYQVVRHYRPDVTVVDKELLRRSWYLHELEYRCPWLIQQSRAEVDAFLKELYKFEHELPYDASIIQARYVGMIRSFVTKSLPMRPVYLGPEIEAEFTQGWQLIPEGLANRVYADTLHHDVRDVTFSYRPFGRSGRLEDGLVNMYTASYNAKALALLRTGKVDEAKNALHEGLKYNPNSRETLSLLARLR